MKLLFDQNLSFKLCKDLVDLFPGSNHVRILGLAEADDRTIWEFARANLFTIVSQDADFADMAMLLGSPPKVLWVRGGNRPSSSIAALLRSQADVVFAFGNSGAVCLELY